MREIKFNVYSFEELSDEAKKVAIEALRDKCYESNSEWTFDDAEHAFNQLRDISYVRFSIQCSSQGPYADHYSLRNDIYFDDDKVFFEEFRKRFLEQYEEWTWIDPFLKKIVEEWQFDDSRSYEGNIAWLAVSLWSKVDRQCDYYYEDERVEEWITDRHYDFEFTENGKPYNY